LARLLDTASRFALFSVSGLKDEKTEKLTNYTVSKLVHFLRHSVYTLSLAYYFMTVQSWLKRDTEY